MAAIKWNFKEFLGLMLKNKLILNFLTFIPVLFILKQLQLEYTVFNF